MDAMIKAYATANFLDAEKEKDFTIFVKLYA